MSYNDQSLRRKKWGVISALVVSAQFRSERDYKQQSAAAVEQVTNNSCHQ
jgi:hypothetical protein